MMDVAGLTQTQFSDRRILVIDDEERLARSLVSLLQGVGYDATAATSGPSGLESARDGNFDLVITDLRMEGVDGFDIIKFVVENKPETALIIITAHASTESAIEAIHTRVADYIPKPFDFEVLLRSIEKIFVQQENERLRRDLINMLTHDIKVPLTSVLGFAQLIQDRDGSVSGDALSYAELIVLNSQKILAMLDNYLTNARVEEGRLDLLRSHFDLAEMINEVFDMLAVEFRKKDIAVELILAPTPPGFTADESLLARAFSNLLSNAAKYTFRGGNVLVRSEFAEGILAISVANTGHLKEEDLCAVFERYRRTATSRGISGSGLGLHVVKCVAQAHGGDARCRNIDDMIEFTMETRW